MYEYGQDPGSARAPFGRRTPEEVIAFYRAAGYAALEDTGQRAKLRTAGAAGTERK